MLLQKHDRRGADGLQIPLLVGEVRSCADHSGEKSAAKAVDAVFHPWIIDRCNEDNTFKAQVIDLAVQWVEQETGFKFEKQWKTIRSTYKGGLGEAEDLPMPFPVERAMLQGDPIDERKEPLPTGVPSPDPVTVPGLSTTTPESLLRGINGGGAEDAAAHSFSDIKLPGAQSASGVRTHCLS